MTPTQYFKRFCAGKPHSAESWFHFRRANLSRCQLPPNKARNRTRKRRAPVSLVVRLQHRKERPSCASNGIGRKPRQTISKPSSSQAKSPSASATVKRARSSSLSAIARSMAEQGKQSLNSTRLALSSSSPSTLSNPVCASCAKTGVELRKVTRSFGRGASLLVIEGIPMWSCPHFGESYFTAQTMHEIERIKALRKSGATYRAVAVAEFRELRA